MAAWVCRDCAAVVAVGVAACPQCRGSNFYEQGDAEMASISKHGGPSDERNPKLGSAGSGGNDAAVTTADEADTEAPAEDEAEEVTAKKTTKKKSS